MSFLAPALPFVAPALGIASLFGKKSGGIGGTPSSKESAAKPVLFGPGQLRTPERTKALSRVTPSLVEEGLKGTDPAERKRLKTRAFEDIDLTTKSAIANLREIFGKTGVRGGVQGSDVSDILEASIGAKGQASTNIEDILKVDKGEKLKRLLALLTSQEPFAVSGTTTSTSQGAKKGLIDNLGPLTELATFLA